MNTALIIGAIFTLVMGVPAFVWLKADTSTEAGRRSNSPRDRGGT